MTVWNVGACFTCTKCLLRSVWRKCPKCGGATVDLRVRTLDFADGASLFSIRGLRAMKTIRVLAALLTFGACLAPIVGPWLHDRRPPELMQVGIAVVMDVIIAWPLFWFFSLYLLCIAHVFRALAWLTSLGAQVSPVGTLKFTVLAKLTGGISRALIPQVEVKAVHSLDGPSRRGVLTEPVTLHFVRDAWGFMERCDVALPTLHVKFETGTEEVVVTHGGVRPGDAMQREGSALPAWLEVPNRKGVRFHRELPAGTPIVFTRDGDGLVLLTTGAY
ncbi:MAG: hypothetical protein ACO1OB_00425 [Archangium sp.]